MSEATLTHTLTMPSVANPTVTRLRRPIQRRLVTAALSQDATLREACLAATASLRAITAVADSVATLSPDDPAHQAACRVVDALHPSWRHELDRAARCAATSHGALRDKAALLDALIELKDGDFDEDHPVLRLAASLATDILQQTSLSPA